MNLSRRKRLEERIERWMWRFRLVAIVPVVMSLCSTAVAFAIGTMEIVKAFAMLVSSESHGPKWSAELLGDLISGIDLYLIGLALLIFGYGVYELLISPIEAARDQQEGANSLLDIRSLDQLKEKLVKVLVVALIVSAFKSMLGFTINDGVSLAYFCLGVLLLALSGYLVKGSGPKWPPSA
jgi:uncharacterized membrane protein YqhA